VPAVALPAMGRFSHEAIAVDPSFGHVYETEDAGSTDSGFYRFIPNQPGNLAAGGRLQMLAVEGGPGFNTTNRQFTEAGTTVPSRGVAPFVPLPAVWVDVDDADPNLEAGAPRVFRQGLAKGGARFARLEGCWWGDGTVYINSTSGGAAGAGQVWQYRPTDANRGQLMLVFESPSAAVLDAPDNICVSPRGGLVICEDGGGTQFLRGLTPQGQIFDFVRAADPVNATEFAGACFSPDGRICSSTRRGRPTAPAPSAAAPWPSGARGPRAPSDRVRPPHLRPDPARAPHRRPPRRRRARHGRDTTAAAAQKTAQTLTFENVATNATGSNVAPFTTLGGYSFENWGVFTTATPLGVGNNAVSGNKFAYGFATFPQFIYRADPQLFDLTSAFLSFRSYDGNLTPGTITVRGYRGENEVFSRILTLTNTAQLFTFNWAT
jgi:hypothetical protein